MYTLWQLYFYTDGLNFFAFLHVSEEALNTLSLYRFVMLKIVACSALLKGFVINYYAVAYAIFKLSTLVIIKINKRPRKLI